MTYLKKGTEEHNRALISLGRSLRIDLDNTPNVDIKCLVERTSFVAHALNVEYTEALRERTVRLIESHRCEKISARLKSTMELRKRRAA